MSRILIFLVLSLISCKGEYLKKQKNEVVDNKLKNSNFSKGNNSLSNKSSQNFCDYLTEMVRSSNFPFSEWGVDSNHVNLLIDDKVDFISCQVLVEDAGIGSIGWVEYHKNDGTLFNTSAPSKNQEDDYEIWYFSTKNTLNKYADFQILIGEDSIKVFNTKNQTVVCSGEIIKESENFASYVGSNKNADLIKLQLKDSFGINIDGKIQAITNSESDISKIGCQFPFYEMFITNDLLVFYDDGYYFFTKTKENETAAQNNFKKEFEYAHLPFDFDDYYSNCYNKNVECEQKYHSYQSPDSDSILSHYAINENPTRIFMLSPFNGYQPIIIAYTDSDTEGYYLYIAKKGQVISSKLIAKMDGDSIEDFNISKDYTITLFKRKNATDIRRIFKKYKISNEGIIN